ncbi:MAG TPA: AAA family ATPase [Methanoregulaceae archaeon]|nr:AAA family ATPase [Methanoregulaceae archaeon]
MRGGDISIITFAHHKGGTGKTTSCLNISGFLVKLGYNVLVVDIDPQANATAGLGIDPNSRKSNMYDIFMSCIPGYPKVDLEEIIIKTGSGIDLAPSSLELVGAEPFLYNLDDRAMVLRELLRPIKKRYDFIMIDTPPSMGQFVVNGLVASDRRVITFDRGIFALNGLQTLMTIFSDIREVMGDSIVPDLAILTRWDRRIDEKRNSGIWAFFNKLSGQRKKTDHDDEERIAKFEEEVRKYFSLVYTVPYGREIYEAQQQGIPISHFAPDCEAGVAYAQIAGVIEKWK